MELKKQYQEIQRLKKEINQRLKVGVDFGGIRELMLYLAQDESYLRLKTMEDQLDMLDIFFNIWLKEKRKLPDLGIDTDIFFGVTNLVEVEQKYQRIKYCGLRIENVVPEEYCEEATEWMKEDRVSGIAIGKIFFLETEKKENNLLQMGRRLRQGGDVVNALLLLEYANEVLPGKEDLLLEEADIWIYGGQYAKALELLRSIKRPSQYIKELIAELERIATNG